MNQPNEPFGQVRNALDGLAFAAYAAGFAGEPLLSECEDVTGWIAFVMECVERESRVQSLQWRDALDRALMVCRCAARVVDSSAYQGVSDEDCDLENAVRNWRALGPTFELRRRRRYSGDCRP